MVTSYADFQAEGDGEREGRAGPPTGPLIGPLTWGQRAIWKSIVEFTDHSWLNFRQVLRVPQGAPADVASVAAAIGALVSRHQSLRTRIRSVGGQLCQVAAAHGRLPLRLVEAGPDDPGGALLAAELLDQMGRSPYDYTREWPVRATLVLAGGRVSRVVLVLSHAAVDMHAARIVLGELWLLLKGATVPGRPGLQSLDVAHRELKDLRRSPRAVEYWEGEYRRLPQRMFTPVGPALAPPYRRALLVSAAADAASRLLAGRHRVSTSTVLLAATATLVAAWTGHDVVAVFTMSNNRYRGDYHNAISKLNQLGMFVLDLTGRPSFAELVRRTWPAALRAYQHAYYDPDTMDRALTRLGRPCGSALEPYCYFNDLRTVHPETDVTGPRPDEATVRAAMADTTLDWPEQLDRFAWTFRLQLVDAPGAVGLSLTADTSHLPPERVERLLRDLEALLVEAAFHEVPWPWSPMLRAAAGA